MKYNQVTLQKNIFALITRRLNKYVIAVILLLMLLTPGKELYAESKVEYDWFWFLYEYEKTMDFQSRVYRPFFLRHETKDTLFDASLMPIIYWRYKTKRNDQYKWLFGLGNSVNYKHKTGVKDYDLVLFPFLYYGNSIDSKDKYMMIWPFGGTIRGKLGHERISPYVFPGFLLFIFVPPPALFSFQTTLYVVLSLLPLYVSYEQKEYKAWSILWPLIQRGKSPIRDDFRILPFYAHNYKKGWYDNYSILMLFNLRKTIFRNDEHRTLFIFPLFGKKWSRSGRISATTILWPFFSWGHNKKTGDYEYNMPWPFVQLKESESPKISKKIFFPFYGKYKYEDSETFFVTPLYFSLKNKGVNYDTAYYINFLIVWYFKRDYKKSDKYYGKKWRYFKIWPLFHVEYNDKDDYQFNLLSLLPLRDPEGYERLYQPLWSIIEYRRFSNGERRFGFLFRTIYQRWGKDFYTFKIPIVFSYSESKNKVTECSFLLSMFSYTNTYEGRYMRILWIPIRLGDGDAEAVPKEEGADLPSEDVSEVEGYHLPGSFYSLAKGQVHNRFVMSNCYF